MPAFTPIGVDSQVRGLTGFLRDLGKMDSSIQKTGRNTQTVGQQFTGLGNKVLSVGATMAKVAAGAVVGLGTAVVGLGAASIKTAISFESAFAGVIKTTDGLVDATGQLTAVGEEVRQGFRDLAKEVPVAVEELAGIGEIAGQLGVSKEALVDFTRTVADLGVATNMTTEEAAFNLARIANIFGIKTEAMGENSQRLGSTIVDLGNNFATTERDIASFAERIAGAGKIAGLTQADILAIGTAMSSVGVEAEAGGTAVQKVLLAINEAVQGATTGFVDNTDAIADNENKLLDLNAQLVKLEAQTGVNGQELWNQYEAFIAAGGAAADFGRELGDTRRAQLFKTIRSIQELNAETNLLRENQGKPIDAGALETFARTAGLTADEFRTLWQEDASKAFELFVLGLGEQGDAAIGTLDELGLTDQRLRRAFLSLAGAGDLLTETLTLSENAWQENTALTEEAEKRYRTTEAQLQLLKNQLRDVGITIGDALLPFINDLIQQARPLIEELGQRLPGAIEAVIGKIRELIAAFQSGGVAGLASALGFSDETIALMQSIGQQIVGVIQFVMEHWEAFKGALIGIGAVLAAAAIAATITGIATAIAALANPITLIIGAAALLGAAWSENWFGIRDILTEFWNGTAQPILQELVSWLQVYLPVAIQAASVFFTDTLIPALQTVGGWLGQNLPVAIQGVSDFFTGTLIPAIQQLADFFAPAIGRLVEGFQGFLMAMEPVLPRLQELLPVVGQLAEIVGGVLLFAIRGVIDALAFLLPYIGELLANAVDVAIDIITGFTTTLDGLVKVITGLFTGDMTLAVQGVEQIFIGLGQTVIGVFEGIKGQVDTVLSAVTDLGANVLKIKLPDFLTPGSPTPFEVGLIGIAVALQGVMAAALTAFSAQAIAVFSQVRILVQAVDRALTLIWEVTLPQLQASTQQTTAIMIAGFTSVQPVLSAVNSLLSQMNSLLQAIASSAERAATAMTEGFKEAAEKIEDKLFDVLDELKDKLEDVKREAEAAASAVDDIGDATPTAGAGPGYQHGANFVVPPGFPRDTFPMRVSSGERVIVIPPGEQGRRGNVTGDTFNMTVNTLASPASIIQQFQVMRALVG
jgi:ElaB/YqjD/DUF883 family membrane-anchored ribosome-binding protein